MKIRELMTKALSPIMGRGRGGGGWKPVISEPHTGAWQQNRELSKEDLAQYHAVFSCLTLISGDISKLPVNIIKEKDGIWEKSKSPAFASVLNNPNPYQNRIQFFESYVLSLLQHGNCYILKRFNERKTVAAMYILDPTKVTPLVSDKGEVFYSLNPDSISGVSEQITVESDNIIHCRINTLYHPLVGISPMVAASIPVLSARAIQDNAQNLFRNQGRPGGILTAAGAVSDETVQQLRTYWESNYTGNNAGKVAVLADGLTYSSFNAATAQDSQLFEQLKFSAEVVCSVFHVPQYKVGLAEAPKSLNLEALNIEYFAQALQGIIERIELSLTEGLRLPAGMEVSFDTSNLLRMDSATLTSTIKNQDGILTINEQRAALNKPGVGVAGDEIWKQHQDYPITALAQRLPPDSKSASANEYKAIRIYEKLKDLKNAA